MCLRGIAGKTGCVSVERMTNAVWQLQQSGLTGRMRIIFELYDSDRSGRIDEQEMYEILKVRSLQREVCLKLSVHAHSPGKRGVSRGVTCKALGHEA